MAKLIFFIGIFNFAFANIEDDFNQTSKKIITEEFQQIKINGHTKAPDIDIEFKIPASWEAQEGDRPHVVKKYKSSQLKDGLQLIVIANQLPNQMKEVDPNEFFNKDTLSEISKEMIPQGAELVSQDLVKVDGELAGMLEYKVATNRVGIDVGMHTVNYFFIDNGNLISMQFSSGSNNTQNASLKMKYFRPLLLKIATSIVLPKKWKKIDLKVQEVEKELSANTRKKVIPKGDFNTMRILVMNFCYWLPSVLLLFFIFYFSLKNKMNFPKGKKNVAIMFLITWAICSIIGLLFGATNVGQGVGGMGILLITLVISIVVISVSKEIAT
ncbi:MAG: hypothetical protein KBD63_01795 [Bacteriovoracaceae bacterium]|nr:hypothetical protein [Bacteriovoracaceae bacterium]